MIFSDAIPVQFWEVDCETFNEEERYGLNHRCFCAPWQCEDEIKIQFQDDTGKTMTLLIYDDEESLLDSITIEETSEGVYFASFIPTENTPEICDKNIKLEIREEAGFQPIEAPDLSLMANGGGAGTAWTLGANPTIHTVILGTTSEILFIDYAFVVGNTYSIVFNFTYTDNTIGTITTRALDGSNTTFYSQVSADTDAGTRDTTALIFTATADTTRLGVSLTLAGAGNDVTLNSITVLEQIGTPVVIAKSDCLEVKEEHVGTVLIAYSNYRNYAGIINNNGSPDLTFYLRIPAVFNEERFPETDETMQLSNNRIISLNSQVKKQRLLETDQMPNYMHLKVKEVLKHQFVTIEEKDWVKEEPYEQLENANKRWPLRRYNCWLTEKEYVVRNIL